MERETERHGQQDEKGASKLTVEQGGLGHGQRDKERQREGERGVLEGCVCEIQPSCSAGNNGREASVEMQIRERVADSLIHVRGLWFRATRTAAYTRGIKEFVLEFCTRQAKGQRALYNVTQCTLPIPGDCLTCAYPAWRIVGQNPPLPSLQISREIPGYHPFVPYASSVAFWK